MSTNEGTVRFAVVDAVTSLVMRVGATDLDSLAEMSGDDDIVAPVPEDVGDETHFYDWEALEFVALPPKPGPWAQFNDGAWVDPRTASDIAMEAQAVLYAARSAASMDKSELLIAMATLGILTPQDAEIAAGGAIPPTIQGVLDTLPPEVFPDEARMVARIKWASDNVISRVNPVIVLAATALGVTDEQMDQIFGVVVPA